MLGENARLKQMLAAAAEPDSSSCRSDTQMAAARAEGAKLEAEVLKLREALASGARHCALNVQAMVMWLMYRLVYGIMCSDM